MEWYNILLGIVVFIIAVFKSMKVSTARKDSYHNDSWKNKKK